MAERPLRETRMQYGDPVLAERSEKGATYHVPMSEREGAEKISLLERASERDFSIGTSAGFLAVSAATAASGGTLAVPAIAGAILGGGLIGGVSDASRNNNELNSYAKVPPPERFNRDAVKGALGWAALTKGAIGLGALALGAAGLPVALPAIVPWAAAGVAMVVGAYKGSEKGYQRMQKEHTAVENKYIRQEHEREQQRSRAPEQHIEAEAPALEHQQAQTRWTDRVAPSREVDVSQSFEQAEMARRVAGGVPALGKR